MKLVETLSPSRLFAKNRNRKNRKGVALVTVLTVMALTTILVLTFFSLATSEHRASNTYSHGLQAQQVAEQAVNLVIAQIREATTVGTDTAWASQPGAIRQWDRGGNRAFAFKLYSDELMKTMNWGDFESDFIDLGGWENKPDHYVDLNEPVIRGEKVYYPIVHPNASSVPTWPQPLGEDEDGVEGFSYNERPGRALAGGGVMGEKAAAVAQSRDGHVAMPVKWIYQLADGTLGVLDDMGGGTSIKFNRISGGGDASADNPIVARFAFWADDETSKLNINTHAGGLAWDIPKAGGEMDMNMGKYQPAQHEWQRYPGHPASTHLSPALAPGVLDIVNDRDAMEMLYKVVPRVVGGGSESGTRVIDTRLKEEENGLIADKEPLYPTLDDVIMRSDREPHEFPNAQGQPIPADELSEYLERSKFFITANSRAPETNLFNLPRVAIWPIYNAGYKDTEYQTKLTPFDRLIHYCASMGESMDVTGYPRYEYIFKREDADSSTHDYELIERNAELYNYLYDLLKKDVPGYGHSFQSKYPEDYQQILTEIFDYIRTTNLHDDSIYEDFNDAFSFGNINTNRTYTNPRDANNTQIGHKGHGQVVPIQIETFEGGDPGGTKGFGRFYSLASVQVQLISCAEPGDRPFPKSFGATSYRGRRDLPISNINNNAEVIFMNFPPQPAGFEIPADLQSPPQSYTDNEPAWLKDLRENDQARYLEAMDPENWNWQLAFLDDKYTKCVLEQPSLLKYSRKALSREAFRTGVTRLMDDEQLVQGILLFNLFTPSIGWGSINPDMEIKIEVERNSTNQFMYFDSIDVPPGNPKRPAAPLRYFQQPEVNKAQFLGFWDNYAALPKIRGNKGQKDEWIFATNRADTVWGGRRYGGLMPYEYCLTAGEHFFRYTRDLVLASRMISNPIQDVDDDLITGVPKPSANADYRAIHENEYPRFPLHDLTRADGYQGFTGISGLPTINQSINGGRSRLAPFDRGYDLIEDLKKDDVTKGGIDLDDESSQSYRYDLVTLPFRITGGQVDPQTKVFSPAPVKFNGGELKFSFYHGGKYTEFSKPNGNVNDYGAENGELIQEITIDIPNFQFGTSNNKEQKAGTYHPMLYSHTILDINSNKYNDWIELMGGNYNEFDALDCDSFSFLERNSLGADPGNPVAPKVSNSSVNRGPNTKISYGETGTRRSVPTGRFGHISLESRPGLFSWCDIVQSVELRHGDARIAAGRRIVGKDEVFEKHRDYEKRPLAHSATNAVGGGYAGAVIEKEYVILPGLGAGGYNGRVPLPFGVEESKVVQRYGDFDNGAGLMIDGPYINKPDEGNIHSLKGKYMREEADYWEFRRNRGEFPYFNSDWLQESGGPAYFSPNRLVSGPGMFGSLPTGVKSDEPWRTLLFRPEVINGSSPGFLAHPGGESPPDHLIMDLFWMPVVEPYAISEPLSTAGKVNMNFDIVPFLHIQRSTALRGVFRSEFMLCIPNEWHRDYKHLYGRGQGYHWRDNPYGGALQGKRLRAAIREDDTIEQFFDRFDNGNEIFKSSTEICEINLIPEEVSSRLNLGTKGSINSYVPSNAQMDSGQYWKDHSLVGDNSRERPYTNIQNRLTTKSNTFLVHYRAQVLKQARRDSDAEYGEWRPELDTVQAEYRGSSLVERYVNPNKLNPGGDDPDFTTDTLDGLDKFYRFRVVNPRRFAP